VSPAADVLILIAILLMLGAALGAAGWRGPLLGGLAGLSVTMILSLGVVSWASAAPFSRLDIALLAGPLGLVYGGLLYSFVIGPPVRRAALLAVGGLLCLGTMGGHQVWPLLAMAVEPRSGRTDLGPAGGRRSFTGFRPSGWAGGPKAAPTNGVRGWDESRQVNES